MRQISFKYRKYGTFDKLGSQSLFSSVQKQELRLTERRHKPTFTVSLNGLTFKIDPGVYKTGVDTALLMHVLRKIKGKTFLEIGCGCGAVSVSLAKNGNPGLAVDINELAVVNTKTNCSDYGIKNLRVFQSDVFSAVIGKFDVLICNPPYNMHDADDDVEKMFWDPDNGMKRRFFEQASKYLNDQGSIYFGWADFNDLDFDFPVRLARSNGLELKNTFSKPSNCSSYRFIVFEFGRKGDDII